MLEELDKVSKEEELVNKTAKASFRNKSQALQSSN